MKSLILPILILFISASCGTKKHNPYLLYKEETDTQWIKFARQGRFQKGIECLNQKIKDSTYRNPHINHLDLSLMFAMKEDYSNAIKHRVIAKELIKNPKDGPWMWHHVGTISFFRRDKKRLDSIIEFSWQKEGEFYLVFKQDLISLSENFYKDYQKATIFQY
ncbi:MAG: hypothetical protein AAF554_13040 [Bacteroidota bacterium]